MLGKVYTYVDQNSRSTAFSFFIFQAQGGIQYMQTLFLLLITMSRSEKVSDFYEAIKTA